MMGPSNWMTTLVVRPGDRRVGVAQRGEGTCPCGVLAALDVHWMPRESPGLVEVSLGVPACEVRTAYVIWGN